MQPPSFVHGIHDPSVSVGRMILAAEAVEHQRLRDSVMIHFGQEVIGRVQPALLQLEVWAERAIGVEEVEVVHCVLSGSYP